MNPDPVRFEWKDNLALRVTEADERQQELLGLYNRVAWACQHAASIASIREAVRSFLLYARWHFSEEEARMRKLQFPGYATHRSDHERLLQDATDFIDNFDGALGVEDSPAIARYFKYWLTRHMAEKDEKFQEFLNRGQIAGIALLIGCWAGC